MRSAMPSAGTINDGPRDREKAIEHYLRQKSGLRVALAGMIRADDGDIAEVMADRVAKLRPRLRHRLAEGAAGIEVRVKCDAAERDDDAHAIEELQLPFEVR